MSVIAASDPELLEPQHLPRRTPQEIDPREVERRTQEWGHKLFDLMERAGEASLFTAKGLYGALMDWAMKDEQFKVQLFRFVDVLPTLRSSGEISRHLKEYLDNDQVKLSPGLRTALKATGFAGGLLGGSIKGQVTNMARMFMLGDSPKEIVSILNKLREEGAGFTLDVLGEAVVSEKEAEEYAARYMNLLELLGEETAKWDKPARSDVTPEGEVPRLNVSVKISAFYSQIQATDFEGAIGKLSERLRPILRRAKELGAFINFDMESYAVKDLTLELFKRIFAEPEFAGGPTCGLAMQAYLKDCERDLLGIVEWARAQHRRVTVRLVKGAYWDYETVIARQRRWPVPVFEHKPETDANFEKLSSYLLANSDIASPALASHNVRSLAHVLAQAEAMRLDMRSFEFQVLYGMGDSIRKALLQAGCRMRVYCPVGELLPGMAYLVRRLLENTSNEGFIAQKFARGASREALLRNPAELPTDTTEASPVPAEPQTVGLPEFRNEPPTDFTLSTEREKVRAALKEVRASFGRRHPLVIGGKPVLTENWAPSLNPANQKEIIGHSARGCVAEAEEALEAARSAQAKWGRTSAEERRWMLTKLGDLLRRDKSVITALMVFEAGKTWSESDADVAEAIDFCNFNGAAAREIGRPKRTQIVPGESNFQEWWPRGVGIVIAPWNFPLAILTGMMSAAVATGNTVILKPSEQTAVLAAKLVDLATEAEFPDGVINLLTGQGSLIGAHLVAHPAVNFIAFTGSMEVGREIWETAGRTPARQAGLKRVICEMGGKNAVIIDSDADLDEAVAGSVHSAFGYAGQKCSALSRLIVLQDNYEKFMERLIAATASLKVGPPEDPGTMMGPVIDRSAQSRLLQAILAGKAEAVLAWQGSVPNDPEGCYVPPTIFADVPRESNLFRTELFGPVLSVARAKDFSEALGLANDCLFALTGGLYSRSPSHIERVKTEMVCGNLYINRPITGAIVGRQPFGGFKMSGGGTKAGGMEYLQQYMVSRVVTENCLRRGFAPREGE